MGAFKNDITSRGGGCPKLVTKHDDGGCFFAKSNATTQKKYPKLLYYSDKHGTKIRPCSVKLLEGGWVFSHPQPPVSSPLKISTILSSESSELLKKPSPKFIGVNITEVSGCRLLQQISSQ